MEASRPSSFFGPWTQDIDAIRVSFLSALPFEHVVIPQFFAPHVAEALSLEFPDPMTHPEWKHYDNPLEQKFSLNTLADLPYTHCVFDHLQSEDAVRMMRHITALSDLEADPHLHGAGLHAYPRNGKLDVHLDYSIHPLSGKERRVNLIVYMNPEWKPEYGGDLQLWNADMSACTDLVSPGFNTAVLFRTSDISFHGLPTPIQCPLGQYRKSLAIYYISPARAEAPVRLKAEFFPLPIQPVDERVQRLYDARKHRLLVKDDLWEGWRQDGNGFW
jgi:hypothetical protein